MGLGMQSSFAQTDVTQGGSQDQITNSSSQFIGNVYNNPVVEQVSIIIANRATQTPTLIQGPASVVANVGGFAQVIPTVISIAKSNAPTIVAILVTFARGAAYG